MWQRTFAMPGAEIVRERVEAMILKAFQDGGGVPWTPAYALARDRLIAGFLDDPGLMEVFRSGGMLPAGLGVGFDERSVEIPWVFSRLRPGAQRVLDAGSTLNQASLLERPVWEEKKLAILTLAPEPYCAWARGISYLFEDLRALPFAAGIFDIVTCVSTLEHVGYDNSAFTGGAEARVRGDDRTALAEIGRVLRPGGRLLLTVPFGERLELPTQQVYDGAALDRALEAFPGEDVRSTFFRYAPDGWQMASREACSDARYVGWVMLPADSRPERFPTQPDGAAAARAVACVEARRA